MAVTGELYVRSYSEVRDTLLPRARAGRNPFEYVPVEEAEAVFARLDTLEHDAWAEAFAEAAEPFLARAVAAEADGDSARATKAYLAAFGLFRVARYPAPNSPAKLSAYRRSQQALLAAGRYLDPPFERVEMPYHGTQAPGAAIVGYLRRPASDHAMPVVVQFGGIDSFKEDRRAEPYLAVGYAVLAVDMPGVGDSPVPGSEHGEELFTGIFDWIDEQPGLDSGRIAVVGASTGGYWATKVAHTHRERVAAVVCHGGPAHFAFQEDWIARSARGEYPFELAETLACAYGRRNAVEWIEYAPQLSLLDLGVLEMPCAPLLLINGVNDSVFPIEDMYLLLRHGSPKTARLFDGGHMGHPANVFPSILAWLQRELSGSLGSPAG